MSRPEGEAVGCGEIFIAKARCVRRDAERSEKNLYTEDTEGHGQQGAGESAPIFLKCNFATEGTEDTEGEGRKGRDKRCRAK